MILMKVKEKKTNNIFMDNSLNKSDVISILCSLFKIFFFQFRFFSPYISVWEYLSQTNNLGTFQFLLALS